jgi:error-prone DNA polymerase
MLDDQEASIDWKTEQSLERIQKDFKAFKTSLADHPVAVIKRQQWPFKVALKKFTLSCDLNALAADTDVFVFGMVLVKQSPGSAKGMVFVTLEDEKGFFNLAFTPQVYTRFYRVIDHQPYLCIVGKLQRVNESHSILVKRVFDAQTSASLLPMRKRHQKAEEQTATPVELVKPRAFR